MQAFKGQQPDTSKKEQSHEYKLSSISKTAELLPVARRSSLFPCSGGIAYLRGRGGGNLYYMLRQSAGQVFIMHKDLIKANRVSHYEKQGVG